MWTGLLLAAVLAVSLIAVIVRSICLEKNGYGSGIMIHNVPEERTGEEISGVPVNTEVITRYSFWNNEMDKFLRGSYPALYHWNTVGNPVGNHINGYHICELLFSDGSKKMVNVMVKADISMAIFDDTKKKKSPEEIAEEWIAQNRDFLLERYKNEEGFLIENKDLPDDISAVDCILTYMTANGDFSTHYGPEGIRCVAEY